MFYYNCKYHLKLPEGSPEGDTGGIIVISGMPSEQLLRKQWKKYPYLNRRLLDPQLYLASIEKSKASKVVSNLATYSWFGKNEAPAFKSADQKLRDWKSSAKELLLKDWMRAPSSDARSISECAKACVEMQVLLKCEAIILPVPLIDNTHDTLDLHLAWIDAGIEAARAVQPRLPIFATIAVVESVTRASEQTRDECLQRITGHITTRDALAGAYVVLVQENDTGYAITSADTGVSIMTLVDDVVRGGNKQVIVNFVGTMGVLAAAAGAHIWATGYYQSLRRLRLMDLDDKGGQQYPRYFSSSLMGDISMDKDMDAIVDAGIFPDVVTPTAAASRLNAKLLAKDKTGVAEWVYSQSNITAAKAHYHESMHKLGTAIDAASAPVRVKFVHELLQRSAALAERVRTEARTTKSDIHHQASWLNIFETWMKRAGYLE